MLSLLCTAALAASSPVLELRMPPPEVEAQLRGLPVSRPEPGHVSAWRSADGVWILHDSWGGGTWAWGGDGAPRALNRQLRLWPPDRDRAVLADAQAIYSIHPEELELELRLPLEADQHPVALDERGAELRVALISRDGRVQLASISGERAALGPSQPLAGWQLSPLGRPLEADSLLVYRSDAPPTWGRGGPWVMEVGRLDLQSGELRHLGWGLGGWDLRLNHPAPLAILSWEGLPADGRCQTIVQPDGSVLLRDCSPPPPGD